MGASKDFLSDRVESGALFLAQFPRDGLQTGLHSSPATDALLVSLLLLQSQGEWVRIPTNALRPLATPAANPQLLTFTATSALSATTDLAPSPLSNESHNRIIFY